MSLMAHGAPDQLRAALELLRDINAALPDLIGQAQEAAQHHHTTMKGYRPEEHAEYDRVVASGNELLRKLREAGIE